MSQFFLGRSARVVGGALASLLMAVPVSGCATGYRATRLSGNLYRVECGESMDRCILGADRVCRSRTYRLLAGGKTHLELGGKTGYQTRSSHRELVVMCGQTPADGPTGSALIAESQAERESRCPRSERGEKRTTKQREREVREQPEPRCTPGETQRCVGPAACEGGQSCKEDGSGFSECDCGAAPGAEADAAREPEDAGTEPEDAATNEAEE